MNNFIANYEKILLFLKDLGIPEQFVIQIRKPEIINSDQGSQYTSFLYTQYLENLGIKISMDSKGRATDNRWIERF